MRAIKGAIFIRKDNSEVKTNNTTYEIFKDYPDVVTIDDLQKMLNIGRNSAYKLVKDKSIKTIRMGKKYIIPKISVISYLTA